MKIARKLYYAFPPSLRFVVRRLFYLPIDFMKALREKGIK